jgi:NAD(P)H-quinone oxidoreductase subunit 5
MPPLSLSLPLAGSAAYLGAAALMLVRPRLGLAWRGCQGAAALALALALGSVLATLVAMIQPEPRPGPHQAAGLSVALLAAFLGWTITGYSRRYLEGEAGQHRYIGALCLTLGAVQAMAVTDRLEVIWLGWLATSLGLHRLLTFYPERPAALMAAHKKFIASRAAELCLLVAFGLILADLGTLGLGPVLSQLNAGLPPSASMQTAAVLLAVAVVLKSAQLPVHGWLMQVMEAPTPVSALLHAGVVNLGGLILIRLSPLVAVSGATQAVLVISGSFTAVLAALVMTTRISVKLRLAWSTCAQMGLMLTECGLGLFDLALLHLVAHSLYKAHAFLSAGDTVMHTRLAQMHPRNRSHPAPGSVRAYPPAENSAPASPAMASADNSPTNTPTNSAPASLTLWAHLLAAPAALALVAAGLAPWHGLASLPKVPPAALIILGLGLAPLLAPAGAAGARLRAALVVLGLTQLYGLWHAVFAQLIEPTQFAASNWASAWVAISFAALYITQAWIAANPQARLSRWLYPWAYAGFHLDERFTRLTLALWPLGGLPVNPSHAGTAKTAATIAATNPAKSPIA